MNEIMSIIILKILIPSVILTALVYWDPLNKLRDAWEERQERRSEEDLDVDEIVKSARNRK